MAEVIVTDEFETWWDDLGEDEQEDVAVVIRLLIDRGVALGFPHSSAIKGSRHALRELRVQSSGRPIRVFYAFDPWRQAVLLIGGDKTGKDRFYDEMVPWADTLFDGYLAEERSRREKEGT